MNFKRRFTGDDRGATAIEYAIIGALIGIGLIGSLIGTKTSLSGIFGVAATQMGSASGSGGQPASLGQTLWGSKTLSSTVVYPSGGTRNADGSIQGGQVQYKYTYADGSYAEYVIQRDSGNNVTASSIYLKNAVTDPTTSYNYKMDASGNQTYVEFDRYSGTGYSNLTGFSSQNAAGTTVTNGSCSGGSCSVTGTSAPTTSFSATVNSVAGQVDYFKQMSAPLPIK